MSIIQTCVAQAIKNHPRAAAQEVPEILEHYILDNSRLNRVYQAAKNVVKSPTKGALAALAYVVAEAEGVL